MRNRRLASRTATTASVTTSRIAQITNLPQRVAALCWAIYHSGLKIQKEMVISMRGAYKYTKPREVMRALDAARARVRPSIPLLTDSAPIRRILSTSGATKRSKRAQTVDASPTPNALGPPDPCHADRKKLAGRVAPKGPSLVRGDRPRRHIQDRAPHAPVRHKCRRCLGR